MASSFAFPLLILAVVTVVTCVLVIITTFISASSSTHHHHRLSDKDILIESRAQLVGDCTSCLSNWKPENPIFIFEGVQTDLYTHSGNEASIRVLSINYHRIDSKLFLPILQGTLPSSWSGLTALESINLGNNQIHGELPPSWSALSNDDNLVTLKLSENLINGTLPSLYANLTSLQTLHLQNNQLFGPLPPSYSAMTNLADVDVSGNSLTGSLPVEFQSLTKLTSLSLYGNKLTGILPPEWSSMQNLETFWCFNNRLSGQMPHQYSSMRKMFDFDVSINKLEGEIPSSYSRLGNGSIFVFSASSNRLSGKLPPSLGSWRSVRVFDVGSNLLERSIPSSFAALETALWCSTSLTICSKSNRFSGAIPTDFFIKWTQLKYSGIMPFALSSSFTVSLARNNFEGPLPHFNLTSPFPSINPQSVRSALFDFSFNRFSGPLPDSYGAWTAINYLYLQNNNELTGKIPKSYCNLGNLVVLDLSKNCIEVDDTMLQCLTSMDSLQKLDLTPKCFSISPVLSSVSLASLYKYQLINTKMQKQKQNYLDGSYCRETVSNLQASTLRFLGTIQTDSVFTFGMYTGARGSSFLGLSNLAYVPPSCGVLLFRPILECFEDESSTIPCGDVFNKNFAKPAYDGDTFVADISPVTKRFIFNASGYTLLRGVYFQIKIEAVLHLATSNNSDDDENNNNIALHFNSSTSVFQANPCQENTSVAIPYSTDCAPCPNGNLAFCDGTSSIYVSRSFPAFRHSADVLPFYECNPDVTRGCLTNNESSKFNGSTCKENHIGFLCARCEENYGLVNGECQKCESKGSMIAVFVVCIVILLVVATIIVFVAIDSIKDEVKNKKNKKKQQEENEKEKEEEDNCESCETIRAKWTKRINKWKPRLEQFIHDSRPQLEKLTVIVRMLINHFTLLGALALTAAAHSATDSIKGLFNVQNSGGGGALFGAYSATLSCLFSKDQDHISESVLNFNILWIVFAGVFAFESLFFFAFTRKITSTASVALFLSFVAFSPLAEYSSKLLALCRQFNFYDSTQYLLKGENSPITFKALYLSTDLSQECDDHFQNNSRVGAALTITLFCSVLPVIIAVAYKKIENVEDRRAIFQFLTEDYREAAWYYELIVMVRKLLVALIIFIFVDHGPLQLQLYTLTTTAFLVASLTIQPLQSKVANIVDQVSISSALVGASLLGFMSTFSSNTGVNVTCSIFIFLSQVGSILAIVLYGHKIDKTADDLVVDDYGNAKRKLPAKTRQQVKSGAGGITLDEPLLFDDDDDDRRGHNNVNDNAEHDDDRYFHSSAELSTHNGSVMEEEEEDFGNNVEPMDAR